jgi:hypothetical protein
VLFCELCGSELSVSESHSASWRIADSSDCADSDCTYAVSVKPESAQSLKSDESAVQDCLLFRVFYSKIALYLAAAVIGKMRVFSI